MQNPFLFLPFQPVRRLFAHSLGAISIALLMLAASATGMAQTAGTGTIAGTVMDANKAVVANASVTILDTDTGITRTLTTNGAGIYSAPFLQPGHYQVSVSASGFGPFQQKNLTLNVGQTLNVDAPLSLGSVQSTVTVSAAAPLLDTEKTEASEVVDQKLIGNLPVNGRRWDNFVLLTPNVAPDGNTGLISYRGISGLYNSNLVDGVSNNQAFFSEARGRSIGAPYVYSLDSIQEFQSDAAAYSAEFGQAAGGQINAITKSGTNAMHGDLFYYLRYPALNALDAYGKTQHIFTQPVHQQQQFGGSVGGPIIKDKLFYFFTYDGFRKVTPITYTSTANITLTPTTDPSNHSISPTQCPSAVSATQCTAAISYLQSLRGSYPRIIKQDIFFPKLDYQLNQANHITASFNWENFNEPNGYNGAPSVTNGSVTQNGTASLHERFFVANLNTVLSSKTVNEVRTQWSRDLEVATTNSPGPSVNIIGVTGYGETSALPRGAFPDEHLWQFTDVLSTTRGKHTLKAGFDVNLIHELLANLFQGDGGYFYSQGNPVASFQNWIQDVYQLNGGQHYNSFSQVNDPITHIGKDDFWNKNLDAFVEDSWRIAPNLLLSLGGRYEVQLVPQPPRPNMTDSLSTLYTSTINIDYHEFEPRLGFSWQPHPTTVVHGGYGIFYGLTSNSTYYTTRVENGVYQQQFNVSVGTITPKTKYPSYAPVAPNVFFTPPGPPLAAPFAGAATSQAINTNPPLSSLAIRGIDPKFLNPYSHEVDLTLEQQLPGQLTLSVGWVANRGMRLPVYIDTNIAPATTTKTYDVVDKAGTTTKTITLPFYTQRLTTGTQSLLAGFSGINSLYNSLVFTVNKPFSHGLEVLANYTWAHATDGGQVSGVNGTFNGTDTPLDPFNRKAEYGRSDLDMRGRFVGSLVYAPVFDAIAFRPAKLLANGWSVSGSYTAQSGFPLTANMANSPASPIGDGGLTGAEVSLFNGPTAGRAPQVGRNAFPGPGLHNVDARVSRSIPIHEQIHLELLGEAFNLLNHRNILAVNSTAFTYSAPSATSTVCSTTFHSNGCIAPYTSQAFGAPTSTNSLLYGPRQLQVSAKLFF